MNGTDHDRPLHIAMVTGCYAPESGGRSGPVGRLAEALVGAGHRVTVLTHDLSDGVPDREEVAGVEVHRFLPIVPGHHYLLSPALARHLASDHATYDVVHAHGYHDGPTAAVTHWWDGALVFSPRLHEVCTRRVLTTLRSPYRAIGRRVVDRSDVVLCASEAERDQIAGRFPAVACRAVVVPDGIDVDHLRAVPLRPTGDRRTVVVTGALDAGARVNQVIAAIGLLRRHLSLEVCGSGPDRAALERLVAHLGLEGDVTFRGWTTDDERASIVRSAACLVNLSGRDDQARDVLEAAAVGTPVVASTVPAHVEARARAGSSIHLVPRDGDVREVAQTILEAAAGPQIPVDLPSWADVAAQMADVYRSARDRAGRSTLARPA